MVGIHRSPMLAFIRRPAPCAHHCQRVRATVTSELQQHARGLGTST